MCRRRRRRDEGCRVCTLVGVACCRVVPLEKTVEAHQYAEQSRTRGKLVLSINDQL